MLSENKEWAGSENKDRLEEENVKHFQLDSIVYIL